VIPTVWLYRLLGIAAAAAALLWLIQSRDHWRDEARANESLLRDERAAHAATVANYRAAAERARREDAQNLARVKGDQAAINERTLNDFESRIAAARASARRLRGDAAASTADPGTGGTAPVPAVPAAPAGAAQAAGENRLPQSERLIATEQAIQLDELIRWVRDQAEVDVGSGSLSRLFVPQESEDDEKDGGHQADQERPPHARRIGTAGDER
jgi:hypothetical protein